MMKDYGFTLVELMAAVAIVALVIGGILGVLTVGRQSWDVGNTEVEVQQQTRRAMDWIVRELRESGSIHVSIAVGGGSITFQVPINDTPDWGAEGNLGWSIRYFLNNQQLLKRVLDGYPNGNQQGLDVVLANNIRSDNPPPNALNFGDPNGDLTVISIEITAQKDTALLSVSSSQAMQSTLNSQVTLRN